MATEYTDNYDLDLYVGEDKPNLRDQYNAAMNKIDTALFFNATQIGDANEAIMQIREKDTAQDARLDSQAAELQSHATDINTLKQTTQSQGQSIASNANAISSLNTRVGTAEGNITNLQTNVNGKAPTNHASSGTNYGVGSATSYGHVRLSDTPSSSSASAGIAATPKMVQDAIKGTSGWTVIASGINMHLKELSGMNGSGLEPTGNLLVNGGLGCFLIASGDRSAPFTLRSNNIGEYKTAKIYTLPASVVPLVTFIPYGSAPNQTASANTMHVELNDNAFYIEVNEAAGIEGAYFFPIRV